MRTLPSPCVQHVLRANLQRTTFVAVAALLSAFTGPRPLLRAQAAPAPSSASSSAPFSAVRAPISLIEARAAAYSADPGIRAARDGLSAASARERQALARLNPTLLYGREQTSRAGQSNAQDIAQLEWTVEIGGQRAARAEAARFRRQAAEANLLATVQSLDAQVVRGYIEAAAAQHRVGIADVAARTAAEAQRISDERLRAGDVAGYAARRLRLESARYAARRAEAAAAARSARELLALLMARPVDAVVIPMVVATDSSGNAFSDLLSDALRPVTLPVASSLADTMRSAALDSLMRHAMRARPELLVAKLEAQAVAADARLAARERLPMPSISAGYKGEQVRNDATSTIRALSGFVAGVSIPLPLFDRRAGAIAASNATARQASAESDATQRLVAREIADAAGALRAAEAARTLLLPYIGAEARVALRAVQAAYAEGEITLAEWLDAVRAWQETELALLTLDTDVALRRVALARASGRPLFPASESVR